jgi:hypothetical protein
LFPRFCLQASRAQDFAGHSQNGTTVLKILRGIPREGGTHAIRLSLFAVRRNLNAANFSGEKRRAKSEKREKPRYSPFAGTSMLQTSLAKSEEPRAKSDCRSLDLARDGKRNLSLMKLTEQ